MTSKSATILTPSMSTMTLGNLPMGTIFYWLAILNRINDHCNSLLNMTLSASCRDGISSFLLLTFLGWAIHFCLPFDLFHVIITTDPMDPKAAKLPILSPICSRVVLLQLHLPLILCIIQNHFASLCLVSMMWDTLWPSFDMVGSYRLHFIIREFDQETPFQYLKACMS